MNYTRLSEVNVQENLNNRIYITFVGNEVDVKPQKGGGEWLGMMMRDKGVSIDAKMFSVDAQTKAMIKNGIVYNAAIDVKPYAKGKNGMSCIIYNIEPTSISPIDYLDWIGNMEYCKNEINRILKEHFDTSYGRICNAIIQKNMDRFMAYPAAKGNHHIEMGGLLWHTVSVARMCERLYEHYCECYGEQLINKSLLVCSAIVHDIGKTSEYSVDIVGGQVDYSKEAQYMGHIITGVLEIKEAAKLLGIDKAEEVEQMCHCVLAHHGKLEWGSPIIPNMLEARILHEADALDMYMWKFNKNTKDMQNGEYQTEWFNGGYQSYIKSV